MANNVLQTLQAVATAAGTATTSINPPYGYTWTIGHIGIASNSSLVSTCIVYQNGNQICGSAAGNGDAADGTPIVLKDGDTLTITWSNCTSGADCTATLIISEEHK